MMADHLYVIQRRFAFYGFWFPQKSGQIGPEYARTVDPKVGGSIPLTHPTLYRFRLHIDADPLGEVN